MLFSTNTVQQWYLEMTAPSRHESPAVAPLDPHLYAGDEAQPVFSVLYDKEVVLVVFSKASPNQDGRAWQRHVLNPAALPTVDMLTETVKSVYSTVSTYGPEGLHLEGLLPDAVQGEHLAATLRATFRVRTQVPGWSHAVAVARAALRRENVDPNDALVGLDK